MEYDVLVGHGMEWNGIESINEIDHMEFNGSYGIKMNHVQFNEWYEIEIRKRNWWMKKNDLFSFKQILLCSCIMAIESSQSLSSISYS